MNRGGPSNTSKQLIGDVLDILSSSPAATDVESGRKTNEKVDDGEWKRETGERLLAMLVKAKDDMDAAKAVTASQPLSTKAEAPRSFRSGNSSSLHKIIDSTGGSKVTKVGANKSAAYGIAAAAVLGKNKGAKAAAGNGAMVAQRQPRVGKLSDFINNKNSK